MVEVVILLRIDIDQAMRAIDLIGRLCGLWLCDRAFGRLLDHLHPVVAIQLVILDHLDQFVGVGPIRGIATLLQPLCPPFVVGDAQLEEAGITRPFGQELGVVGVGLLHRAVLAKAFPPQVVVVIDPCTFPFVAFDAKMVVRSASQVALPGSRL